MTELLDGNSMGDISAGDNWTLANSTADETQIYEIPAQIVVLLIAIYSSISVIAIVGNLLGHFKLPLSLAC